MNAMDLPRRDRQTLGLEVGFSLNELFFSRTDSRGVIQSGNEVFQRVSMFEWDEILKAPHKIIRHPDMPKAVFWLLWNTIQQGLPIGAFVKNRAKDGRFYWVFAIVTPMGQDYLSVRLKPSSPLLAIVEAEYAALVKQEREQNLTPPESAERLLGRLADLGFRDYPSFMAAALGAEVNSREDKLDRVQDPTVTHFEKLLKAAEVLLSEAQSVASSYNGNQFVAFNMRIQAAHLELGGRTLGVISTDYSMLSEAIRDHLDAFIAKAKEVYATIVEGEFLQCTSKIQREVVDQFRAEVNLPEAIDMQAEIALLEGQQKLYVEKAQAGLERIEEQTRVFVRSTYEMQRLIASLEVTRVMGKIECSHLREKAGGLTGVLDDLEEFQQSVSTSLKKIEDLNQPIAALTGKLLDAIQPGHREKRVGKKQAAA